MTIIYIVLYGLFLIGLYVFIIKRLKILSNRHKENTGIDSLSRGYRIIRRRLIIILLLMFFFTSLVLITFTNNDLLPKVGLRDDKETLDNNDF